MKKAILVKSTGEKEMVYPKNKRDFSYEELRGFVGGIIQIVPIGKGRELVCHDEGKLIGLPYNAVASKIWNDHYPIEEYPHNNDQTVVGDILISGRNLEKLL